MYKVKRNARKKESRDDTITEKYKKYIGVDKIYNDIKTVLESNYKVLESFRDYK